MLKLNAIWRRAATLIGGERNTEISTALAITPWRFSGVKNVPRKGVPCATQKGSMLAAAPYAASRSSFSGIGFQLSRRNEAVAQ
jgi:hypothetical protein